ncbi:MAG: DUF1611 domain-containing protein [Armatimonadota bacterium]
MIDSKQPIAIYMEGALGQDIGKMGYGILRYSPNPIACVIDSYHVGKTVSEVVTTPRDCPVVSSVEEAAALGATIFALGTAPPGGRLPESWRGVISEAVKLGMSVINGLHEPLAPQYPHLKKGQVIWDVRQEPTGLDTGTGKARFLANRRILMVGTDMAVGKMTAGLELWKAAGDAGVNAGFVATGQIGITVTGAGIPLDAIRVDYASGAVEREVLRNEAREWVIVEGQGSIIHPGSTSTMPLLRGSMPTDMILCLKVGQTHLRRLPEVEIPPIPTLMRLYEDLACAGGTFPAAQVRGLCANTSELDEDTARRELADLSALAGVPAVDPVRFGCLELVDELRSV